MIPAFRADTSSLASPWLTFLGRSRPSRFLNRLFCRPLKKYDSRLSGRDLFSHLPLAYLSRAMSAEQVFEPTCIPTPQKSQFAPFGPMPYFPPPLWLMHLGRCPPRWFLERLRGSPIRRLVGRFRPASLEMGARPAAGPRSTSQKKGGVKNGFPRTK